MTQGHIQSCVERLFESVIEGPSVADHASMKHLDAAGYEIVCELRATRHSTAWLVEQGATGDFALAKAGPRVEGEDADERGAEIEARLHQEARALAHLSADGVPRLYRWIEDGHASLIIMQWIDGVELRQALAQSDSARASAGLLERALETVAAIHRQGVVHRDLKPEHFLVTASGKVHVVDFGLAALTQDDDQGLRLSRQLAGGDGAVHCAGVQAGAFAADVAAVGRVWAGGDAA